MASRHDEADVLVIGAGASGAAFTWSLTLAGIKVVCLEQGGWVPLDVFSTSEPDAQIHWQTDFHSNPNVRGLPEDYPVNEADTPISPLMYNAVGGSTIHWGSHFPRFHPSDFVLKSQDGVADDWPMTYAELEPYYDLNDRMNGVSACRATPPTRRSPSVPRRPWPLDGAVNCWQKRSTGWAGTGGLPTAPSPRWSTTAGSPIPAAPCARWPAPTSSTGPGPYGGAPASRPSAGCGRSWWTSRVGPPAPSTTTPTATCRSNGPG